MTDGTPMAISKKLLNGNKIFREKYAKLMKDLATNGQQPKYAIIACTDSRNDPAIIFQLEMGDAFVFRTIGALISEHLGSDNEDALVQFTDAHLAFYSNAMSVPEIIIMGHTGCGAAQAIATGLDHKQISPWLIPAGEKALKRVKNKIPDTETDSPEFFKALEKEMVIVSHEHLTSYPIVKSAVENGSLKVTSLLHELPSGNLYELNADDGSFFLTNAKDFC